jgi:hypothetical protein
MASWGALATLTVTLFWTFTLLSSELHMGPPF